MARRRSYLPQRGRRALSRRHPVPKPVRRPLTYGLLALAGSASVWALILVTMSWLAEEHPMFVCYAAAPGVSICAPVTKEELNAAPKPPVTLGQ